MEHIYEGKTKSVFKLEDGNFLLKFKDDATGENGVFDPGANTVGLSIEGLGKKSLAMSSYYFRKLEEQGIHTQFIDSDIDAGTMVVKPCKVFGEGLEVICRFIATGSFVRRYGKYVKDGAKLNDFVEITIKDDEAGDPIISKDALIYLGIMTDLEYNIIVEKTKQIAAIIKDDLAKKGLTLYDIKLEFGTHNGEVILIDEISGGNMRVYKGTEYVMPLDLADMF